MEQNIVNGLEKLSKKNMNMTEEHFRKNKTESMDPIESKICAIINNSLQEEMQEIRQDVLQLINNRINDIALEILQRVEKMNKDESKDLVDSEKYSNRTKPTRKDALPDKQFLQRNSILTDMYEIKHIRTIYNFIVATLIILLVHTAIYDIRQTGAPNLGIGTVRAGFGKFSVVLRLWSLMQASAFVVYAAFCCWATRRLQYTPNSFARQFWDYTWLVGIILYDALLLILPTKILLNNDLPLASSFIVLMEQARFAMKTHAFVRSVAPRFLHYKPHSESPVPQLPGFSKYLYFMFVPTLIYQDDYPRAKRIRWNVVATNFAEVLTSIFSVALIYERLLYPNFCNFGKVPVDTETLILNILSSMLPGILMFVCGFYLLLHSWMNAFAEVLRFGDKMFYKDWWNSICFSNYYRTWNIVVHDWLYTYVYKDMYEIIAPRNKKLSICMVFAISAIVHEYIVAISVKFFYPVMLILFGGAGLSAVFIFKTAGNVFMWFCLSVGNGVMLSLYCMEYFARIHCPPVRDDIWDFFIPRSWTCEFK